MKLMHNPTLNTAIKGIQSIVVSHYIGGGLFDI